jgi:hypothetical protein
MPAVLVQPPDYPHSAALAELAETVEVGLKALALPDEPAIVLGAHLLVGAPLPTDAIIYNTEHPMSGWMTWDYRALLSSHPTWCYYDNGMDRYVPIGYVPEMTRITSAADQDIDVLFYGSINRRRLDVLLALRSKGLNVHVVTGVYGATRDALIARAKVVLNMHFYLPGIFEMVRVSYLWANRKCVVSEGAFRYDELVQACAERVEDDELRVFEEGAGFAAFSATDEVAILAEALRA